RNAKRENLPGHLPSRTLRVSEGLEDHFAGSEELN
ncbi:hypothetical protein PC119_g25196, partial [Phytophthora cactorum]